MSKTVSWITLAVALCLCQGCHQQSESPEERKTQEFRALLTDGNACLNDGEYVKAMAFFDRAVSKAPDRPEGFLNRGIAHVFLKTYPKAVSDFTEAIALDPQLALAYANRGIAYDHMGKPRQALADYRQALSINPEKVAGPGFMERFLHNKPKTPAVRERAAFLEKMLKENPPETQEAEASTVDRGA